MVEIKILTNNCFQANTEPVLEYYRKMNICQDFHGTESKKIWPHVETYLKTIL